MRAIIRICELLCRLRPLRSQIIARIIAHTIMRAIILIMRAIMDFAIMGAKSIIALGAIMRAIIAEWSASSYYGELLSDCLPLPFLTWTEVAPCVAALLPPCSIAFFLEALFATPPSDIWTGTPPSAQRTLPFEHFTVRARSAARCASSFTLPRAVDAPVRLTHDTRTELRCAPIAVASWLWPVTCVPASRPAEVR
jgi:hypothetical protein